MVRVSLFQEEYSHLPNAALLNTQGVVDKVAELPRASKGAYADLGRPKFQYLQEFAKHQALKYLDPSVKGNARVDKQKFAMLREGFVSDALVLEPGPFRERRTSVLPAAKLGVMA